MPAAMHLTALVFLFGVTLCRSDAISSTTTPMTTSAASSTTQSTGLAATTTKVTSTVTSTTVEQSSSTAHQNNTSPTLQEGSSTPPPPTSPQTPNTPAVVSETVSSGLTLQPEAQTGTYTGTTTVNTSNQAGSENWGKGDMKRNPGLVAILCIFCVILVLVLVVAIIKCAQSPRSKFERLEDMPMGKVSEDAPFAHYSK